MIEKLLANPYAGDGMEHPDMHLIYVELICGLFKLAGLPRDEVLKKVLSASWEQGSPDLPAYGPRCGSTSGPVRPIFTRKHPRPQRGAKPRGVDDTRPPRGLPHQAGSRGAERSRQGAPHEVFVTQAMTTEARRTPARTVSSFPLWC